MQVAFAFYASAATSSTTTIALAAVLHVNLNVKFDLSHSTAVTEKVNNSVACALKGAQKVGYVQ